MPLTLARLRRTLGRLLAVGGDGPHLRGEGGGAQCLRGVGLTVRARTSDGADLRLLLEARLVAPLLPDHELERLTTALVVPAAAAWVRRRPIAAVEQALAPRLLPMEEAVRPALAGLGAELVEVHLVACEHLLVSPSGDPAVAEQDRGQR